MKTFVIQLLQGIFILGVGFAGYAWNPEKARSALISGCVFGGLNVLWGAVMYQGGRWANTASLIVFSVVLTWRAYTAWTAYMGGALDKLVPASLVSLMLAASIVMMLVLRRTTRVPSKPKSK